MHKPVHTNAMGRRDFLAAAAAGLASWPALADTAGNGKRPPNVVVIMADDLGYADIGVHGCKEIETPNIDRLAAQGVRFTDGYVTYPACAPSRAGLLTGRHQWRFGFSTNPDRVAPTHPDNPLGLPLSEITLAEALKDCGYDTGIVGKWHLGHTFELHPQAQGFDRFYGFLGSLYRYFDLGNLRAPDSIMEGKERVHEQEYLTHAFTREAREFVTNNQDSPFLLYLAYNAVHTPLMDEERPPDDAHITLKGSDDPRVNRRTYVDMVESMDRGIGELLDHLEALGLEEDTLVFFLGDNGGARETGAYDNHPLRDYKGTVYEGGIRVPFIMRWPGKAPAGAVYTRPVSAMDIFATSVAAAGGEMPKDRVMDGVDLMPYVRGEKEGDPHGALFWRREGRLAIRKGDWKLVQRFDEAPELYNLAQDIGETQNLAKEHPARTAELLAELENWKAQLPEPLWVSDPEQWKAWQEQQKAAG